MNKIFNKENISKITTKIQTNPFLFFKIPFRYFNTSIGTRIPILSNSTLTWYIWACTRIRDPQSLTVTRPMDRSVTASVMVPIIISHGRAATRRPYCSNACIMRILLVCNRDSAPFSNAIA